MPETTEYRLALLVPDTGEVLAAFECGAAQLPRIAILRGERQVEQLTDLVKQEWNIGAVVLDILPGLGLTEPCAVLEVRSSNKLPARMLCPVDVYSIDQTCLTADEAGLVASFLGEDRLHRNAFARIGWVEEVQRWIINSGRARSCAFSNDIRQLNAGGGFVLARIGTTDGLGYWLKAVGAPNEHEFDITKALAERIPTYLPPIVTICDEWKAWITEDAGQPLSDSFTLPSVQTAVTALAKLQRDSIDHGDALRAAGCTDCNILVLEAHLRQMTEYLEEAMSRQTSTRVAALESSRLRELEDILRAACYRMQDLCIPDALIHNDINAGNILLSDSGCAFIDWAEGQIGNPFLTFQHVCVQVSRDAPNGAAWLPAARRCYQEPWLELLGESQINRAYALMPVLSLASYLYGRGTWLNSADRDRPHFQTYTRTLARCIDRAAQAPELKEALCK